MIVYKKNDFSLEAAYKAYADMLYRLALSYTGCGADAEDVLQEAFLKYYRFAPDFADEEHMRAWLIRVTVNCCHDHLRRLKRRGSVPLEDAAELAAEEQYEVRHVMCAVAALPEKYRACVVLHSLEGYTVEETAAALKLSVSAIKMRLSRAREMLRERLTEERKNV